MKKQPSYEQLEVSGNIPVADPDYWQWRLQKAEASGYRHKALYYVPLNTWRLIERQHRKILRMKIGNNDSVLDVGCAWGRLLDLLPTTWNGKYLGIDVASGLVELAQEQHPNHQFKVGDVRQELPQLQHQAFDWAVMISVRSMIIRNLGQQTWDEVERELRRVCWRLLFLEYDPKDVGEVK